MARSCRTWWALVLGTALIAAGNPVGAQQKQPPAPGALPLPPRALQRLGTAKLRHGSRILCLAYAGGSKTIVAGGGHDPVRVWDAETGKELHHFDEPWVYAIAIGPLGNDLYTAGAFKVIRQIDLQSRKELSRLEGHKAPVKSLALSPFFNTLASGGQDGTVHIWNLLTRTSARQLKGHTDEVTAVAFSTDPSPVPELLATGSTDRTVILWKVESGNLVRKLDAGCGVQALVFSDAPINRAQDKAKYLFTAGDDYLIRKWEVATGKLLATLKGHTGIITNLRIADHGKTLVSTGHDATIRLWNADDGTAVKVIKTNPGDNDALAVSKDGARLAVAGINDTIRVFDAASGNDVAPGAGPQSPLSSLALAGTRGIAAGSSSGRVYLWDGAGKMTPPLAAADEPTDLTVAASPDGKLLASGGRGVQFWNAQTGEKTGELSFKDGDVALAVRFAPDGKTIAVGLRSQQAQLWDVATKKLVQSFKYSAPVYALAFSRDGAKLAISGGTKLALFETASGKPLKEFASKDGPPAAHPQVAALEFGPDGKTLAAGCYDGFIRLYDVYTGKEIRNFEGHQSVPYSIAFTRDGRTLASGSFDRTVRLWEAFSGQTIAEFKGHTGPVLGVAFTPDDRRLYSASADTTVLCWDVPGTGGSVPAVEMSAADLEAAWRELALEDTAAAHRTVWRLIGSAKSSAAFLGKKVYLLDPEKVAKMFKDLNSENYETRTGAMKSLESYGSRMEGRIAEALKDPGSLEVRRRLEQLLNKLRVPGALTLHQEQLRERRVMMVLEQIGDATALRVLESMSRGAAEDAMKDEARGSVRRLQK